MKILDDVKTKISYLGDTRAAYILAHAAWSACDHRKLPGPAALEVSAALDPENIKRVFNLYAITMKPDYCNDDQAEMLRWLHQGGYTPYIAKQIKTTAKKLVDWE